MQIDTEITPPTGKSEEDGFGINDPLPVAKTTKRIYTRAHTRRFAIEGVLIIMLAVGGGLLTWGANFTNNMVHNELADQKIFFPLKNSPELSAKEFPKLQQYAGQAVDNGPKSKAYADQFIAAHLKLVAGGKTYAEVSSAAQLSPTDTKLAGQANTLFKGETLRGLLLSVWGWSVIAHIASLTAMAAFAGLVVLLWATGYGLFHPQHA